MKPSDRSAVLLPALALMLLSTTATAGVSKSASKPAAQPAPMTAAPAIQLDPSTIKGEQSLPKVLNIVPWKRASGVDLPGRPEGLLLDEVLAPLDRGELRRQLRYEADLKTTDTAQAKPPQTNPLQTKE